MADEVSNKTLAILVVAAIVVTLGGTMLVLRSGPSVQLTGLVTSQEGTAKINVSTVVDIELEDTVIDFGTGHVNDSALDHNCIMNTEQGPIDTTESNDCLGDWNSITDYMWIQNEGNVPISLTVNSGLDASGFITGSSPSFQVKSVVDSTDANGPGDDSTASCSAGAALDTYSELGGDVTLCDSLGYEDSGDELVMYAKATVPSDAATGSRTTTWTFTASDAS